MADPQFTPGPWFQVGRFGQEVCKSFFNDEGDLKSVVTIAAVNRSYKRTGLPSEEMRANADLIAAAPDLYEVLRRALMCNAIEPNTHLREAAEEALKKANGGAALPYKEEPK